MEKQKSTLRMLRRRHCRCNLLVLLAVCAVSAVALLRWGFMDAVKRSTLVEGGMQDAHGAPGSRVSGGRDGNVENFAPPLHGAPPEDKEEEEEEEREKSRHGSHEKHGRVTTTRRPAAPPKSELKPAGSPEKRTQSEELSSKDVEGAKPSKGVGGETAEKTEEVDSLQAAKSLEAAPIDAGEKSAAADGPDDQEESADKTAQDENKLGLDELEKALQTNSEGLPAREKIGSDRIPSTLLEVLDAAQTTASMQRAAPEKDEDEEEEAQQASPIRTAPPPQPTRPRAVPTTTHRPAPTTTTEPPYTQQRRLPGVVLIGAVSCPVDVVVSFLHLHPDIVLGGVINFFNDDVNYKRGFHWYANQMPMSYPDQVTIDVNPTYYLASQTPERIYRMNPHTKLLFVVCDPIMRALAHHVNSTSKEFDALAFHSSKDGRVNERYEAIQYSLYYYHMQRWLKIFPKRQLLVIDVGTLRKNLHSELTNIENFLGIQHNILNIPSNLDPAVMKKLQKFFQTHNEDFFKAIGRRFEWQ